MLIDIVHQYNSLCGNCHLQIEWTLHTDTLECTHCLARRGDVTITYEDLKRKVKESVMHAPTNWEQLTSSTPDYKPAFHHAFALSKLAVATSRRNNNRKARATNTACQRIKVMRAAILLFQALKTMLLFTESKR